MAEEKKERYNFGRNCVCIGRVSTSSQSQTAQERDLIDFAKSWGYKKIKTFFTTESGFLEFDAKQGWNLVTDFFATHPDYRVLICPELSRLSRKEFILYRIKNYLIENKIQLIVKDINFVLYNEWGEIPKGNDIIFALYASLADSEMRQRKERKERVLKDNRQLGYSIGGKELFGYERHYEKKDGRNRSYYRINEKEAEEIRDIFKWYAFGIEGDEKRATILSITKECVERGYSKYLHSKRNVNKALKESAYIGSKETHNRVRNSDYWVFRKYDEPKYIKGQSYICTYPPILTGDNVALFALVQERLKQNNTRYTKHGDNILDKSSKHTNILAKLLVCPDCGTYLNSEYRLAAHSQRPHLGKSAKFSYRCNNSRGVVHVCSFRRSISMPLLDSVLWSYCKDIAFKLIIDEQNRGVKKQVSEIDAKIRNIETKIQEFDIDSRLKAEDAILRARSTMMSDSSMFEDARKTYEEHVAKINKELMGYKKRKLELEKEKEMISEGHSVMSSIQQYEDITSNKTLLYKYIHLVVDKIVFVAWDKKHLILKVKYKKLFPFLKKNEYVVIYSTTAKTSPVLIVNSYDKNYSQSFLDTKWGHSLSDEGRLSLADALPSTDNLFWDNKGSQFMIDGETFSLEELKEYADNLNNARSESNIASLPIAVRKLAVERLACYSEDEAILRKLQES